MKNSMKKMIFVFLLIFIFESCKSTQIEVPLESTSREIIQMAQSSYDKGKPSVALQYYTILLQRYGMDNAIYVEGQFEIAHIHTKKKHYDTARPILEEIIALYDASQPWQLPGAYKKLAIKDLEKCNKKNSKKSKKNS